MPPRHSTNLMEGFWEDVKYIVTSGEIDDRFHRAAPWKDNGWQHMSETVITMTIVGWMHYKCQS